MSGNKVTVSVDADRLAVVIALIADLAESSGNLWPLDENHLEIGDGGITVPVWTLTVERTNMMPSAITSVHASMEDARQTLFENYDDQDEFGGDVEKLEAANGISAYIEPHAVTIPYKTRPRP